MITQEIIEQAKELIILAKSERTFNKLKLSKLYPIITGKRSKKVLCHDCMKVMVVEMEESIKIWELSENIVEAEIKEAEIKEPKIIEKKSKKK